MKRALLRTVLDAIALLVACPAALPAQQQTPSTLRLDRPKYRPGDCLRITVTDPDQNREPARSRPCS